MNTPQAYGKLCSIFYDATKTFAPPAEVDFYASYIEKHPGRVLEAMSGSGRLQIPLIKRGFTVDGVDNSTIMLDRCRKRCIDLSITADLYEQALEDLKLPERYATITIAVGSFQLIHQRNTALKALKQLRKHMTDNGQLLIDLFTPPEEDTEPSVRIARLDNQSIIRLTTRHLVNKQERLVDALCNYELIVNGAVMERESEILQVTWYTDAEISDLMHDAGLQITNVCDVTLRSSGPSHIIQAQPI